MVLWVLVAEIWMVKQGPPTVERDLVPELAAWLNSLGVEPGYVHITHPHANHFLALPQILAAFPDAKPAALAASIPAMEEQISPGYMKVRGGFFPGQLTKEPVAPAPLTGTTVPAGGSAVATVIPVGTSDTGHSGVVHLPGLSLVVSGDVVCNQAHISPTTLSNLKPIYPNEPARLFAAFAHPGPATTFLSGSPAANRRTCWAMKSLAFG
jgi:glyoxylase-like metal-dependent hydrolase (beta-lactamase superfamily II)